MREDELRTLLTGYTAPTTPGPSPAQIRGRATRRRFAPVGVAAVAVVTVGALVAPQLATSPAVPAPAVSPAPSTSSWTPTPTPSPSATPGTPTPTCHAPRSGTPGARH